MPEFDENTRQKLALSFLKKGVSKTGQSKIEFTAYSQACICMAQGIYQILLKNDATLFAVTIPREVEKPKDGIQEDFLRKDQVFLLERFYYFLEGKNEHGLIIMDETDKSADREFVSRMFAYFTKTQTGRLRSTLILPSPLFVASDMAYAIQAADICIYCINWGYRLNTAGMNVEARPEITENFMPWIQKMQFHGEKNEGNSKWPLHGIVCVPDPYESRYKGIKKGETRNLVPPKQVMPASSI